MDITNLNARKGAGAGADLQLKHPVTGADLPDGIITVAGSDSDAFKAAKYAVSGRRMADPGARLSMRDIESDAIEILAACVISWGKVTIDGKTPADNIVALTDYPWIKEQVEAFVGKRANFIGRA